jgi:hypothetical protein
MLGSRGPRRGHPPAPRAETEAPLHPRLCRAGGALAFDHRTEARVPLRARKTCLRRPALMRITRICALLGPYQASDFETAPLSCCRLRRSASGGCRVRPSRLLVANSGQMKDEWMRWGFALRWRGPLRLLWLLLVLVLACSAASGATFSNSRKTKVRNTAHYY